MRSQRLKPWFVIVVIAFSLSGCQKDQAIDQPISGDEQIILLADQSWNQMASEGMFPENPSLGIDMLNEGIAPDFLIDESYLEDLPPANTENLENWYAVRNRSIIRCLRGIELSPEQTASARQDLQQYGQCKHDAVQRARSVYRELRMEYKQKFHRLVNAYRNGTLTEREFKQKVTELRADFRVELHRLHLQERLDEALKGCLHKFLRSLHGTLTESQWDAFVECYRGR